MGNKSNKTKNKFQTNENVMDKKSKETMKKFQSSDNLIDTKSNIMTKRFKSSEYLSKTYTCWLSISCTLLNNEKLPPNITEDDLEGYFKENAKQIGAFHSINLKYIEKHKSFQCFINFFTEDSAKQAVKLFDRIELENFKIKSKYWLPKGNDNAQNPLLSDTDRKETAAKGKTSLLQNQSDILPRSNSKNTKRYIVIDGNNVAIQ
jgi:hypothetical protein